MTSTYKEKYLKYKTKYISLKNSKDKQPKQYGGGLLRSQINVLLAEDKVSDVYRLIKEATKLIPENRPGNHDIDAGPNIHQHQSRQNYTLELGHAIPTLGSILNITQFANDDKILEIGAGMGLQAALIQRAGGDITPTDIEVPSEPFTNVIKKSALDAVREFRDHNILLMIWPPPNEGSDPFAEAVDNFQGKFIIYYGTPDFEVTGNHNLEEAITRNFNEIRREETKSWFWAIPYSLGDNTEVIIFYQRKT